LASQAPRISGFQFSRTAPFAAQFGDPSTHPTPRRTRRTPAATLRGCPHVSLRGPRRAPEGGRAITPPRPPRGEPLYIPGGTTCADRVPTPNRTRDVTYRGLIKLQSPPKLQPELTLLRQLHAPSYVSCDGPRQNGRRDPGGCDQQWAVVGDILCESLSVAWRECLGGIGGSDLESPCATVPRLIDGGVLPRTLLGGRLPLE
jgi:hypothetical protein